MSVINKNRFQDGQTMLSASQLNDIQTVAQQIRKGQSLKINGANSRVSTGLTQDTNINIVPRLYKAIDFGGESSSSESSGGEPTVNYVYGQQVDAETGNTYGPILRFHRLTS